MEKLNVRLVVSRKMDERGDEDNVIRTPKRFRENFPIPGKSVTMKTDRHSVRLVVKQAWAEDVAEQREKLKKGYVTKAQRVKTAFVTTNTFSKLVGSRRKKSDESCYLSTDIESLMIGADPEFGLTDLSNGKLLYASQTGAIPGAGELGHDGPLAEVRPDPHDSISGIVTNISDIFKRGQRSIKNFNWVSGATYRNQYNSNGRVYHLGGHIHIGDPVELPSELRGQAYKSIIQVLDELVAMPLVRIDTPEPHVRRNEKWGNYGMYGRWGDQRPQEGRFEWRVLSGLWLAHPDLARAVLGATKAVSESCYMAIANKGFDQSFINCRDESEGLLKHMRVRDGETIAKLINEAVPGSVTKSVANSSVRKLKDLPNFKKYQGEIEEFERLVNMSVKDRKYINLDLRDTWINQGKLIKEN